MKVLYRSPPRYSYGGDDIYVRGKVNVIAENWLELYTLTEELKVVYDGHVDIKDVKPILRPWKSMTKEEVQELGLLVLGLRKKNC